MQEESQQFEFPANYPDYFAPGQACVKTEYLDTLPEGIARRFEAESGYRASYDIRKQNPLTTNQLRAFYQHAKKAQAIADSACAVNEIKKLAFHAQDRLGKRKISKFFSEFIQRNVARVDERSLDAFLQHFEAVVGFSAGRLREKDES